MLAEMLDTHGRLADTQLVLAPKYQNEENPDIPDSNSLTNPRPAKASQCYTRGTGRRKAKKV
jgi:hypothetical protein